MSLELLEDLTAWLADMDVGHVYDLYKMSDQELRETTTLPKFSLQLSIEEVKQLIIRRWNSIVNF